MNLKMTVGEDDNGSEIEIPAKWVICRPCQGNGKHSRGVESAGGGITSSEWAEWDPEERETYLAGGYDQTCDACDGTGKVKIPDEEACTPAQLAALEAWYQSARELAAERRYQRLESGDY